MQHIKKEKQAIGCGCYFTFYQDKAVIYFNTTVAMHFFFKAVAFSDFIHKTTGTQKVL